MFLRQPVPINYFDLSLYSQHQRSRSALVETINGGLQGPHQRSKSLYMQNDLLLTTHQPITKRSPHNSSAAVIRTPKSAVRFNPETKSCNNLTPPVPPPKVGKLKRIGKKYALKIYNPFTL